MRKSGNCKAGAAAVMGDTTPAIRDRLQARASAAGARPVLVCGRDWQVREVALPLSAAPLAPSLLALLLPPQVLEAQMPFRLLRRLEQREGQPGPGSGAVTGRPPNSAPSKSEFDDEAEWGRSHGGRRWRERGELQENGVGSTENVHSHVGRGSTQRQQRCQAQMPGKDAKRAQG